MTSRYYTLSLNVELVVPETVYEFVTNQCFHGCRHIDDHILAIVVAALVRTQERFYATEAALNASFPLMDLQDFSDFVHTLDTWCVVQDVNDDDEDKVVVLDTYHLNDANYMELPPLSIWDKKKGVS